MQDGSIHCRILMCVHGHAHARLHRTALKRICQRLQRFPTHFQLIARPTCLAVFFCGGFWRNGEWTGYIFFGEAAVGQCAISMLADLRRPPDEGGWHG